MSNKTAEKLCPCIVNKDSSHKAKDSGHKAKDLTCKAKAKAKDLKKVSKAKDLYFVLKDNQGPRPRTNITGTYTTLLTLSH